MSTEDTDPAVVAAGAINAEMTVSLLRGEIKLMADIIREEYAQRDKAWAELAERAYREGERDRGAKDWGDWDASDSKGEVDVLMGGG